MSRTPFHAHTDPPGCIYRKDDRDIFFNSRETTDKDTAKADRKPVCKGAVNSFGVSPTNLKPVAAWDQAWYFASDASASLLDISGSSLSRDIQSALKPLFLFLFHPVPSCSTFRIVRRLMTSEKRLQRSVSSVSLGRPFAQGTRLDMAMPDLAFGLQIRVARHGTPWHALISDLYPICIRFLYPICIRFVNLLLMFSSILFQCSTDCSIESSTLPFSFMQHTYQGCAGRSHQAIQQVRWTCVFQHCGSS